MIILCKVSGLGGDAYPQHSGDIDVLISRPTEAIKRLLRGMWVYKMVVMVTREWD